MKKVIHNDRGFYCISCSHMLISVRLRFKVECEVLDDSRCSTLKLFDREVAQLVNCSAADLLEELVSELGVVKSIPERIQDLIGKKVLFKLKISKDSLSHPDPTYTVIAISENEDLMKKFKLYSDYDKDGTGKQVDAVVSVKETQMIDLDPKFDKVSSPKKFNGDVDPSSPVNKKLKSDAVEPKV